MQSIWRWTFGEYQGGCVLTNEECCLVPVDAGEHAEPLVELAPSEQSLREVRQHAPVVLLPLFVPVVAGKGRVRLDIRRQGKRSHVRLKTRNMLFR